MDPIKEYGLLALIVVLIGATVWFAHDEREVGMAKIEAQQHAADAKEAEHVKQVESNAAATIADLQTRLTSSLAAPPQPSVVVRMCHRAPVAAPSSGSSGPGPKVDGSNGSGLRVGNNDQGIDVAPATEAILARDKSMIDYLQGYIRSCQSAGACAK